MESTINEYPQCPTQYSPQYFQPSHYPELITIPLEEEVKIKPIQVIDRYIPQETFIRPKKS